MDGTSGFGKAAETLSLILKDACGIVIDPLKKIASAKADRIIERRNVKHELEIETLKLAERAKHRQLRAELRRQYNLESIGSKAIGYLGQSDQVSKIDEDWLNYFLDSSKDIGDESLQDIWARILASSVQEENQISRVTLDVLKRFSPESCRIFERVAPFIFRFNFNGVKYGIIDIMTIFDIDEVNNIHVNGDLWHLDHLGILNSSVVRFNFPQVDQIIHEDAHRILKLTPMEVEGQSSLNAINVSIAGLQLAEGLNISLDQNYLDHFYRQHNASKERGNKAIKDNSFSIEIIKK